MRFNQLNLMKTDSPQCNHLYKQVINRLADNHNFELHELISVEASDTVKKLASGGNAKTDIVITLNTAKHTIVETISVKNTTQSRVSCHDYKAEDFIRVLDIS